MIVIQQQLQRGKLYCDYLPLQTCKQVMIVIQQQLQRGKLYCDSIYHYKLALKCLLVFCQSIHIDSLNKDGSSCQNSGTI
jgi:hypothetical protein